MKRITVCLFILICCAANIFAIQLKVNEDANIRNEASSKSEIIKVVPKDTVIEGILSDENENWFKVSLDDGTKGFIHKSLVDEIQLPPKQERKGLIKYISIILDFVLNNIAMIGIIVLVIWIIAIFLSKTTRCVIVFNWYDIIILLIPGCIFSLYIFKSDIIKNDTLFTVIFIISFCISVILSVIGNVKSKSKIFIINIFVSILTKLVLIALAPVVILALLGAAFTGKKDGRFRDGTKGNAKTLAFGVVIGILGLIIVPLVKTDEMLESTEVS